MQTINQRKKAILEWLHDNNKSKNMSLSEMTCCIREYESEQIKKSKYCPDDILFILYHYNEEG